jgi:catechol 2,3-dioxygenase-like lactoylglutathione lyase family enzyme
MIPTGLSRPVQIAYPVRDVVAAAHEFSARTGAGPFFVLRHIDVVEARIEGLPGVFDHSSAYGQWGPIMVELVEEHSPAIVEPGSGIHHLAFLVDDLGAALAETQSQGWDEVLWARTGTGQAFSFSRAPGWGHLVEMYEPTDGLLGFYARVAEAAQSWDRTDPVRILR